MILRIYEAGINGDGEAVVQLHEAHKEGALREEPIANVDDGGDPIPPSVVAWWGLMDSAQMVQKSVQFLCRPTVTIPWRDEPFGIRAAWQFDNLLAAIYLQMYWLITSGDELARCQYCGRTITHTRTHPQGRKRRRDKKFCDDACRQAHHRSKKKG